MSHDPELTPIKYRVGHGNQPWDEVTIEERQQMDGPALWCVAWRGRVLNRAGQWEYEPIPSEREDDFLERCRFASADEALAAYRATVGASR